MKIKISIKLMLDSLDSFVFNVLLTNFDVSAIERIFRK